MTTLTGTSGRIHSEFVRLLFLQDHRETDRVGVVPCVGWPGGSGPVFGVAGWEWSRVGGGRVGVVPCVGWPGGSGPVLGVAGWELTCSFACSSSLDSTEPCLTEAVPECYTKIIFTFDI
jgi:hypothetical protein